LTPFLTVVAYADARPKTGGEKDEDMTDRERRTDMHTRRDDVGDFMVFVLY
jgi:hypothetical protein